MARILMVLTSHAELGVTGRKTGLWLEEFAAPFYEFLDAGHDVVLASPRGGAVPIVFGYGLVHGGAILEAEFGRIAHHDQAVAPETQGAAVEMRGKLALEALRHACLNGLNGRGLEGDVRRLRLSIGDEEGQQPRGHATAGIGFRYRRLAGTGCIVANHLLDELACRLLSLGGREIDVDRDAGRQHQQTEQREGPSELAHDRLQEKDRVTGKRGY